MTNEELAHNLETIAAMVEWDYPINYASDLLEAAKRLREKHGYWIDGNICSVCEREAEQSEWDYCGHCGAKMEE